MTDELQPGTKILVVDDDPNVVKLVRLYLERDGHEVLTASDGAAGLELAREEQPSLIVLDLMLPRMGVPDPAKGVVCAGRHANGDG